jgi:hypothetical protein
VFENDLASDIRAQYRSLVEGGATGEEATDRVLADWGRLADDEEDGVQIWLGLAAAQSQLGRLEDRVRDRAVAIIDAGADLDRWQEDAPEDVPSRRRAIATLRRQLLAPQGPPKRVRKQTPMKPRFAPGDIVAFRLEDDRSLLLRVVGHDTDAKSGETVAIMEIADWIGMDIPDEQTIASLPRLVHADTPYWAPLVIGPSVRGRLSVVGHFEPPAAPVRTFKRFGLLPRSEQGWHLAYPGYLRWDALPAYALHLLGEGPDPDENE